MSRILALLGTPVALRRVALASIITNVGIVITGGAVRLTGSGLGCPTWPRCTRESYVVTTEMGAHGAIEFGNRLLTFVVGLVAVLGVLIALQQRPRRPGPLRYAALVFAGVVAQAVLGGLTVLTGLNPWVVGGHFLLSMAVLTAAYAFWRSARTATGPNGPATAWTVPPALRGLAAATVAASAAVLVLGTVVTGSGPHAGDAETPRNGLDPQALSQMHADGVFLLVGLSVGLWLAVRAAGGPPGAVRAAAVLVGVELAQGLIGFVQYLTDLPEVLVVAHMGGACAVWLAAIAAFAAVGGAPGPGPIDPEPFDPAADLPEALTLPPREARETRGPAGSADGVARASDDPADLLGLTTVNGKPAQ